MSTVVERIEEGIGRLGSDEHSNDLEQLLVDHLATRKRSDGILLDYFIACYQRLETSNGEKVGVRLADELRYIIVSYVGLTLLFPALFPQPPRAEEAGPRLLVSYLTGREGGGVQKIPSKLVSEILMRFAEDEAQFEELFGPVLVELGATMRREGLLGRFLVSLEAIAVLLAHPLMRTVGMRGEAWKPETVPPAELPKSSLLAGMLSVGVDEEDMSALIALLPERDPLYVAPRDSAYAALRSQIHLLASQVHQLLYSLMRSNTGCREAVLDWFGWLAGRNADRLKMHVEAATVTPDRVMANAYLVLLCFCEPFLGPFEAKLALIDPLYHVRSDRIASVLDTTKNNADTKEYASFVTRIHSEHPQGYTAHFVSECFFLTLHYFRLGPVRMINKEMALLRELNETQQAVEMFEQSQSAEQSHVSPLNALALANAKKKIQALRDVKLALDVYLLDVRVIEDSLSLILLLATWLLRLVNGDGAATTMFRMLPESLVESLGEYCLFVSRFQPDVWLRTPRPLEPLFRLMVALLDQPNLLRNPYLRAKFVEILLGFTDPHLEHLLAADPVLITHLAPKLMRFYIEVEVTGASSQFYDKFNIRYSVTAIFKALWRRHPAHRQRLIDCSQDGDMFVRFTNLLLNDVTYLLDEAISKLAEIHERQVEMAATTEWAARPVSEQREREHGLRSLERQCESYLQLATADLGMLEDLTQDLLEPFLRPEVVGRLAAMLGLNMVQMVGPKCSGLKVRNPEKYHWQPRRTLSLLTGILLNLSREEIFLRALAQDSRSFSVDTFERAAQILLRHAIRPPNEIAQLREMALKVAELATQEAHNEEALGEVPEEFLDALMFTVMTEPVRLETSGQIVDRATIVAHLLNDPTDPFNRQPLTMDALTPLPDLKARIQDYLDSHRKDR